MEERPSAAEPAPQPSTSGALVAGVRGALAGPIAGVCSRLVTYPPDTIKARLQVQGAAGASAARYAGTADAVAQVWRREGVRGFYRGFSAVAVGSVPANLAYFGAYEAAAAALPAGPGPLRDMAVGAAAQLVGGLLFTPIDIVKERMQVAPLMAGAYSYSGPWAAAADLVRRAGPLGLFTGYWATNAVWLPWSTLYIAFYEGSKRAAAQAMQSPPQAAAAAAMTTTGAALPNGSGPTGSGAAAAEAAASGSQHAVETAGAAPPPLLSPLVLGLCSAGSASLAGLLTHPADVVKTRLQVLSACAAHSRETAWSLARRMWATEGARVFMTGLGARIVQLAPGTALSWVIYEPVKRALAPPPD